MKWKDIVALIVSLAILIVHGLPIWREADTPWEGDGTYASPYLIQNADDLVALMGWVNYMYVQFEGMYFLQTQDIDMESVAMDPIGEYGGEAFFYGTYDGGGHCLKNLYLDSPSNTALFGCLGGVVINLGIDSGFIKGNCVGSIASHAAGSNAMIINCYNRAGIYGNRAGGIADNFFGKIVNCWSDCELIGNRVGGIVSYNAIAMTHCASSTKLYPPTFDGVEADNLLLTDEQVWDGTLLAFMREGIDLCMIAQSTPAVSPAKWVVGRENPTMTSEREKEQISSLLNDLWTHRNIRVVQLCLALVAIWSFVRCVTGLYHKVKPRIYRSRASAH